MVIFLCFVLFYYKSSILSSSSLLFSTIATITEVKSRDRKKKLKPREIKKILIAIRVVAFPTIASIREVTSRDRSKKIKPLRVCNGEEREKRKINHSYGGSEEREKNMTYLNLFFVKSSIKQGFLNSLL